MASPSCALRTNRCATAASISCHGMREASTASGWRRSIIWSMRARKKSSVAGQANMAVKLPENNCHWTTNWEFRVSDKPPTTNVYAGHGDFSGTTKSFCLGSSAGSSLPYDDFLQVAHSRTFHLQLVARRAGLLGTLQAQGMLATPQHAVGVGDLSRQGGGNQAGVGGDPEQCNIAQVLEQPWVLA